VDSVSSMLVAISSAYSETSYGSCGEFTVSLSSIAVTVSSFSPASGSIDLNATEVILFQI
jgi:hypothetical protein